MRILLINPWDADVFPPPSVGYLQAALRKYKIDVTAKNINEALTDNSDYDIIAASFHSFSVKHARKIRDKFKGRLVCGGHHPSALPQQMLNIGYDQVVIGEGENAIIDIVNGNENKIIKNCDKKYFKNIDDFPFPDYTGLSYTGELGINIISSRGCPFDCSFCASTNFWHNKYNARSSENVLSEIYQRISEGHKAWVFEDDNFTANKKRVFEICDGLDGTYRWGCQGRAESLSEDIDMCRELYRAGCRRIILGIESFSQETLDRNNKKTNVEKMIKGIKTAESCGISTFCLFLIGLPGDTQKNVDETVRYLKTVKISEKGFNIAWILPGTKIYQKAKEYGFNDEYYLEYGAPYYTYENSIATMTNWVNQLKYI